MQRTDARVYKVGVGYRFYTEKITQNRNTHTHTHARTHTHTRTRARTRARLDGSDRDFRCRCDGVSSISDLNI